MNFQVECVWIFGALSGHYEAECPISSKLPFGGCCVLHVCATCMPPILDIFETPVTMTPPPQQEISKTANLPKFPKILNVYFWGDNVYFGGNNIYFWGINVYFWVFSKTVGFFEFIFCCWGGFGTLWVRGACRGFQKCLTPIPSLTANRKCINSPEWGQPRRFESNRF